MSLDLKDPDSFQSLALTLPPALPQMNRLPHRLIFSYTHEDRYDPFSLIHPTL